MTLSSVEADRRARRPATIAPDRYVLIIGAMKCATTSVFDLLAQHPEICPASVKEPEFFSKHQGHRAEITDYASLWNFDPACHRYALEASTGYTKFEELGAEEAMREYGIRPRMIYIVRNPFDRIESHYNYMRSIPEWRRDMLHPNTVQTSNYHLYLDRFARVFGRERILILDYDRFVSNPLETINETCAFLDLTAFSSFQELPKRNATDRPKSSVERALRRWSPAAASRAPEQLKKPIRQVFQAIRPERIALTPGQRRTVFDILSPGMTRLKADFGIDVARWGF